MRTFLFNNSKTYLIISIFRDQTSFRDEQIGKSLSAFFSYLHSLIQKPEYAPLSNVMILIYVHMVTDNAEDLAVLLSNILGHKVILKI